MQSNMMNRPLLVSSIIEHAVNNHPETEIVSRRCEGDIHRYTIADSALRAKKLANALSQHGISQSDRIATLAWNNYRHYELYFGVAGMGAVLHTINPRLFPEQLIYIINHAKDKWLFVDELEIKGRTVIDSVKIEQDGSFKMSFDILDACILPIHFLLLHQQSFRQYLNNDLLYYNVP